MSYETFINNFLTDFTNSFSDYLNNNVNCTQNIILDNSTFLVFDGATIENCTIDINQANFSTQGEKLCSAISERLYNMPKDEIMGIMTSRLPALLTGRTDKFKNMMINVLTNYFSSTNPTNNFKCGQNLFVNKDQTVRLLGTIKCTNGSTIIINNKTIARAYMDCISAPIKKVLLSDPSLKKEFLNVQPSTCLWDKIQTSVCTSDLGVRNYKINIVKQGASCQYTQNQIISESCSLPECKVGEWSEDNLGCDNGQRYYTRPIIQNGENCPPTRKSEICTLVLPRNIPKNNYEWLSDLSKVSNVIKIPFSIIFPIGVILGFCLILIYIKTYY